METKLKRKLHSKNKKETEMRNKRLNLNHTVTDSPY